jgi:hypothetical protein
VTRGFSVTVTGNTFLGSALRRPGAFLIFESSGITGNGAVLEIASPLVLPVAESKFSAFCTFFNGSVTSGVGPSVASPLLGTGFSGSESAII